MFKVVEYPLKSDSDVLLEVPIKSKFLGVFVKNNIPVVAMMINTAQKIMEQVKLVTALGGEEFGSLIIGETPEHVGTFQHAVRIPPPKDAPKDVQPEIRVNLLHIFVFRGKTSNETSPTAGTNLILS